MEFYFIRRFKSDGMSCTKESDALMEAGLFKSEEEALAECEKRARRIFEWATKTRRNDVTIKRGSNQNWCVEYKQHRTDDFHVFWNYYVCITHVNE